MCVCPILYVEIRDLRKLERASGKGRFFAKARRKTGVIVRLLVQTVMALKNSSRGVVWALCSLTW